MKQIDVTILGQGYRLSCPEGGEAQLAAAVAEVDREMSSIRDSGKVKARERIAVLAALNVAYRMLDGSHPLPRSSAGASSLPADDTDIAALIERIDSALGHDGQLL